MSHMAKPEPVSMTNRRILGCLIPLAKAQMKGRSERSSEEWPSFFCLRNPSWLLLSRENPPQRSVSLEVGIGH